MIEPSHNLVVIAILNPATQSSAKGTNGPVYDLVLGTTIPVTNSLKLGLYSFPETNSLEKE